MKFSSVASVDDPAISIRFEERLGSWILSLQGGNEKKVLASLLLAWKMIIMHAFHKNYRFVDKRCVSGTTPHHSMWRICVETSSTHHTSTL